MLNSHEDTKNAKAKALKFNFGLANNFVINATLLISGVVDFKRMFSWLTAIVAPFLYDHHFFMAEPFFHSN